ncbi:hypothetical protein TUMSATVNIG1_60430 (plasmid) [Vibrio nigripulchritudo]|nr:hypothetical protein VNTUMSATTG_59940 [Vibrio nigripulchritudo]BDU35434.1 hypothetical protein TUMSATVNIG1_60430 [Vibrio nigripulchritudo]
MTNLKIAITLYLLSGALLISAIFITSDAPLIFGGTILSIASIYLYNYWMGADRVKQSRLKNGEEDTKSR